MPSIALRGLESLLEQLEEVSWPLVVLVILAYLQFVYLDVSLEIATLPRLIVFVLVGGAPPPV